MTSGNNPQNLRLSTRGSDSGVVEISSLSGSETSIHEGTAPCTPLSPSSAFVQTTISDVTNSFLDAVVFCHWDNILGPRLEQVWHISDRPQPHRNILRFITTQVLSGEICRELHTGQVDFKFSDVPDKGIVVPSFVFSANRGGDLGLHAIALVIPNSELTIFLQTNNILQAWFTRMIAKLRVLLNKRRFGDKDMQLFTSWLQKCLQMLSSLQEAGLPHTIHLTYTALCPSCNLEQDFLQQAIASHLMTFGRSIVVGHLADRVNLVVHTLSLFSWEWERACSRQVLDGKQWPYAHDLCIQGLLKNKEGSYDLPVQDFMYSKFPSTIIDVQKRNVQQTSSLVEHPRQSYMVAVEELSQLYHDKAEACSIAAVYQSADIPETLIKTLLDELHKLPVQSGIREAFIAHFMHLLQRRALTMIKYVEVETQKGRQPLKGGLKKLCQDLNLSTDGDFRIILATAEKLKPGLCDILYREKRHVADYLTNSGEIF